MSVVALRPDLRRLREEIERLRERADTDGFGTMAYFLTCARIEADAQIRQAEEELSDAPDEARWKPIEH